VKRAKLNAEEQPRSEPRRRRGRPKNADGERTREALLKAAVERLASGGYDRMTLEEVP
jgi:AcrR family transcriptional regulator